MTLIHKTLGSVEPGFYLYYIGCNAKHSGKWVYLFEATEEYVHLLRCTKSEYEHSTKTYEVSSLLDQRTLHRRTLRGDHGALLFQLTEEEYLIETAEYI